MIQNIPQDILFWNIIAKYLTVKEFVYIRLVCRLLRDITSPWKTLKFSYPDEICPTELFLGDNFSKRLLYSCRYCNAIFSDQNSLYKHINQFGHRKSLYSFFYLNFKITFSSVDFFQCLFGTCKCPSKMTRDISRFRGPVIIKTLYGSLLIRSLVFWTSGIHPKGFNYIQYKTRDIGSGTNWKIYDINRHYWIYGENLFIPIIQIE